MLGGGYGQLGVGGLQRCLEGGVRAGDVLSQEDGMAIRLDMMADTGGQSRGCEFLHDVQPESRRQVPFTGVHNDPMPALRLGFDHEGD